MPAHGRRRKVIGQQNASQPQELAVSDILNVPHAPALKQTTFYMLKNCCSPVLFVLCFSLSLLPPMARAAEGAPAIPDIVKQLNEAFVKVAEQASPSVVVIKVAHRPNFISMEDEDSPFWDMLPKEFRKQMEEQREKQREEPDRSRAPVFDGQGSGVVVRKDGYILTNRHVVDGAEKIKVLFADGREYSAEIRGVDLQSDLAVLKIEASDELKVAKLGDSSTTRVGEFAIAIGAPFELDYSVTFGHVSAKGRSQIIPDPILDQDFLQTDANINPGNSGGPLVNIYGEVIGINTLIRGLRTGIGFAIPINLAREVADQLIEHGKFTRAYLGVQIRGLRDVPNFRSIFTGISDGVVIQSIPKGGPAAASKLRAGDVVTAVDGRPVSTPQQLRNEIRSKKIGGDVVLDVYRKDETLQITVQPGAWPEETLTSSDRRSPRTEETAKGLGMTVKKLTPELAEKQELEKVEGVVVTEVEQRSPADLAEIKAGDVITEIDQQPVTSLAEFREAFKKANTKKGVIVNFISRGASKFEILRESGD